MEKILLWLEMSQFFFFFFCPDHLTEEKFIQRPTNINSSNMYTSKWKSVIACRKIFVYLLFKTGLKKLKRLKTSTWNLLKSMKVRAWVATQESIQFLDLRNTTSISKTVAPYSRQLLQPKLEKRQLSEYR